MKIPDSLANKPEAARALEILEALGKDASGEEVFEAFEQLDDLPADIVRAVLTTWTGPAPDASRLEPALRRAHGLPALPLALRCARVARPESAADLAAVTQSQIRQAGLAWDGRDLSAELRLVNDGSEASFFGTIELKTFVDEAGKPRFDVVLHGPAAEASGAIFAAGHANVVGAVAYGIVELADRAARMGLQAVLTAEPDPALAVAPPPVIAAPPRVPAPPPVSAVEPIVDSIAETPRMTRARQLTLFGGEEEPATERLERPKAKKKAAAKKKAVAKKKTVAKKKAVAKVAKKTAVKKTAVKKTAAKVAKKKTVAAVVEAPAPKKKTAAKKVAKKKTVAAAVEAPAPKKKTAAKVAKVAKVAKKKAAAAPAKKKTAAPAKKKTGKTTAKKRD